MDWEIYQTGGTVTGINPVQNSTIILQNNKEYEILLNWVSINGGSTTYPIGINLLPGDTYKWTKPLPFNCTSGGGYSYTVTFDYDNLENAVTNKIFTGVEKLAGACSN
jgi:hypothetical protein